MKFICRKCFRHLAFQIPTRKCLKLIRYILITITTILILRATVGKLKDFYSWDSRTSRNLGTQTQNPDKDNVMSSSKLVDGEVTPSCFPKKLKPDGIKTPFKFYIYDLPSKFNYDLQKYMSIEKEFAYCYDLMYCGTGTELNQYKFIKSRSHILTPFMKDQQIYTNFTMSLRDTHQFALEVIIHYKLLHSKYRTTGPEKADIFYIPAYTGLRCLKDIETADQFIKELFSYLRTNKSRYFNSGKPHFSTLSKIQREQGSKLCSTLRQPESKRITYIAIEKESNPGWSTQRSIFGKSILVAPYPSYIHFAGVKHDKTLLEYQGRPRHIKSSQFRLNVPPLSQRNILLFLAAGSRRTNPFRAQIIDQFPLKTHGSYEDYIKEHLPDIERTYSTNPHQVMLITNECSVKHRTATIPWMLNSAFCVQPPGDSPTRKSFYDAILSGCIPIIFKEKFNVTYPFQNYINYNEFTITIPAKLISEKKHNILQIVQQIPPAKVRTMHENLLRIGKWFQYSLSDGGFQEDDDAITMILQEIQDIYKF